MTVGIPQVSGIETDVASLSTKKLDECQEYDITIIPRLVGRTFVNETQNTHTQKFKKMDVYDLSTDSWTAMFGRPSLRASRVSG